jgi:CMP-N-acetylneuraminic acid synthetase
VRIAAFVPMRHSSERVKGKNYRLLGGRPLFHHIVETLLSVETIDEVVIDTDSPVITEDVAATFPTVRVLERPEHLRAGEVPMNDVLLNSIEAVPADLYLQTHSTNPLLRAETVRDGIDELLAAGDTRDSLFTVTPLYTRLWTPEGKAINHDPAVLLRTQDLPPVMEENSCMYLFDAETLRRRGNRIGERPILKAIPAQEAWDIDDELDWQVVESLFADRAAAS